MIELPIKKFTFKSSANRFLCVLKSDDVNDDSVLKKLAKKNDCTKLFQYKDCFEHVMKYNIAFNNPQKKEAFMTALINCKELQISDKLTKRYA